MKSFLKKCYRRYCSFFNRLPILNRIKISGKDNQLNLNSPLLKSRIIISGNGNEIIFIGGINGGANNLGIHIDGNNNKIIVDENVGLVDTTLYMEDSNNMIHIGLGTKICGKTELACIEGTTIEIGENCLFSSGINFRTGDSHSVLDLNGVRINQSKDIRIGNHVWIGNDVKILKGAQILDNSIVATGSVVLKKMTEDNSVIAGNPAKVVKQGVNWKTERI